MVIAHESGQDMQKRRKVINRRRARLGRGGGGGGAGRANFMNMFRGRGGNFRGGFRGRRF